nr:TIGR03747 family integrating conjugative element membrane protein [uncultured Caldimonas sp.]
MSDPVVAAQKQQVRQQGVVAGIITLPFRFVGVLCGSLLLSIVIECVGIHLFWPDEGWRHAQAMLHYEMGQVAGDFPRSLVVQEPGRSVHKAVESAYEMLFVSSGLREWIINAAEQARTDGHGAANGFMHQLARAYTYLETYLLAAAFMVLVFIVRLAVLCLAIPLFALAAFAGLVDGLVRRDIRRFGAGRESGFLFHRAKACLMPLAVLPWVVYLALPVSINPLWILLPCAVMLGLTVDIVAGSFKKYL